MKNQIMIHISEKLYELKKATQKQLQGFEINGACNLCAFNNSQKNCSSWETQPCVENEDSYWKEITK